MLTAPAEYIETGLGNIYIDGLLLFLGCFFSICPLFRVSFRGIDCLVFIPRRIAPMTQPDQRICSAFWVHVAQDPPKKEAPKPVFSE